MANDVTLNTFPGSRSEALTMLYLQNQDLSDKTPGEIVELYLSVKKGINETLRELNPNKIKAIK